MTLKEDFSQYNGDIDNLAQQYNPSDIKWEIFLEDKNEEFAINSLINILQDNKSWMFSHKDAEDSGILNHLPDRFMSTKEYSNVDSLSTGDEDIATEELLESSPLTEPFIKKTDEDTYTLTGAAISFLLDNDPSRWTPIELFQNISDN